jgi:hypothetical protein
MLRIISYGGGVQSTALCVLATQGKIGKVDGALFANVGSDSEHPATITYVREVMIPWASEHGLVVHELHRVRRDGTPETLMQNLTRPESRSIPIPVRMENGAPGTRQCTDVFKIKVVRRWLRDNGVTKKQPATVLVGFSTDEMQRVNNRRLSPYEIPEHPLLNLGLNREACKSVIRNAGLPIPGKSACYFCPFHRPTEWSRLRRDEPALFIKSVALERLLNERRDRLGKDHVYLSGFGKSLDDAIAETPPELPFDEIGSQSCDEGYCWT